MGYYTTILTKLFRWIIIACLSAITISGCQDNHPKQQQKFITVEKTTLNTPLYFTGNIMPLKVTTVVAPVEGSISQLFFTYGSPIHQGQKLFTITSSKLAEDFKNDVTNFFKDLDDYHKKKQKLVSNKKLYQLEFISRDDFEQSITDEKESYVSLTVAKLKLQQTFTRIGIKDNIGSVDFQDAKAISQFISQKKDTLTIYAPCDGIATIPTGSSNNKEDNASDQITIGSQIKEGQTLVAIGDMRGLSVNIQVNETTINKLHTGQAVTVTGIAFPNITLQGEIAYIQPQAKDNIGAAPAFPVTVQIPKITTEQAKIIHLGMTSKVAVTLEKKQAILIPIQAIHEKDHRPYVTVYHKKSNTYEQRLLDTGKTTLDAVEVKSGLKPGEIIVYHH